jgi:hypothetical protein
MGRHPSAAAAAADAEMLMPDLQVPVDIRKGLTEAQALQVVEGLKVGRRWPDNLKFKLLGETGSLCACTANGMHCWHTAQHYNVSTRFQPLRRQPWLTLLFTSHRNVLLANDPFGHQTASHCSSGVIDIGIMTATNPMAIMV